MAAVPVQPEKKGRVPAVMLKYGSGRVRYWRLPLLEAAAEVGVDLEKKSPREGDVELESVG
jgi:hypothetical protein